MKIAIVLKYDLQEKQLDISQFSTFQQIRKPDDQKPGRQPVLESIEPGNSVSEQN